MDFVKRWLSQVQVTMGQLTLATKMLIGTLSVMILASLLLVALYAGRPEMVPLLNQPLPQDKLAEYAAYLDARGIAHEQRGSQLFVPPDRQLEVMAMLQQNQMLPDDTSRSFDDLAAKHTWWQSRDQSRQLYQIAKQNVLGKVIAKMRGVTSATVIISRPEQRGFDATYKRPSASVNVVMAHGKVDQKLVDAVAGLVAGSVAEMQPEDVTVIDAVAGRQWTVRSDKDLVAGDYMEFVQQTERLVQNKITAALAYIPKVIVAVNVEADIKRRTIDQQTYSREDSVELVNREFNRSQTSRNAGVGGEPGVRSNTGAEIPGAIGGAGQSDTKETETQFDTHPGQTHTVTVDPGGILKRINATVNIPRSYFVSIYRQTQSADATADPTDVVLKPIIAEYTDRIRKQVQPLLAAEAKGDLWVDVYPDADLARQTDLTAAGLAGRGPLGFLGDGMVQRIGLGALALVSLGLMLLMIRSGSRRHVSASPAELAGVPPSLLPEEMILGEADEGDAPLPGMELDENQLRTRKLVKQVSELVHANPEEVVNLVQRWVKRPE